MPVSVKNVLAIAVTTLAVSLMFSSCDFLHPTDDEVETAITNSSISKGGTVIFDNTSIVYTISGVLMIGSGCTVIFGEGITVDLLNAIWVNDGGSLIIRKGATLRFDYHAYIEVGFAFGEFSGVGSFEAIGTADDSITFTALGDDDWGKRSISLGGGICFYSQATVSMSYCSISKSVLGINAISGDFTLTHSTVSECTEYGVLIGNTYPSDSSCFEYNSIVRNSGYGLGMSPHCVGKISSTCTIADNGRGIQVDVGTVYEDAHWNKFDDPYYIEDDVTIGAASPEGVTVTVDPGTVFLMNLGGGFIIGQSAALPGTFIANGTVTDSIIFTTMHPGTVLNEWGSGYDHIGFNFGEGATDNCSMTCCVIDKPVVGLKIGNGAVTVKNCRISNSRSGGIILEDGEEAAFSGNTFTGNGRGDIIVE